MNRQVIISTGFDRNYFPRAQPYLESVIEHGGFDRMIALSLNFKPDTSEELQFAPWEFIQVNESDVIAPHANRCLQHGAFLPFLNMNPNDVIVFTDSDMKMQRRLWPEEMKSLQELKHGEVFVGENKDADETLYEEATFLRSMIPVESLPDVFTDTNIRLSKCYNTGLMAASAQTFGIILEEYAKLIHEIDCIFNHYARQQWLISYILGFRADLRVRTMPQTFHLHGCHGAKPGTNWNGLSHTHHGVDVLFAHNLDHCRH